MKPSAASAPHALPAGGWYASWHISHASLNSAVLRGMASADVPPLNDRLVLFYSDYRVCARPGYERALIFAR